MGLGQAEQHCTLSQGWAIPCFGQQYYTQYYTGQKYAKLYNTLYQYQSTNFKC